MASLHSFYLAPEAWQPPFQLDSQESHHLVRVLRIKEGTTVRLFDGQGRSGLFTVQTTNKNAVALSQQTEECLPQAATRCTLAAGFSKALRRGWFLEKAVELEAAALWFWQGDYSQASLPDAEKNTWKASLIAGAKQCENPWLPELSMIQGGVETLAASRDKFDRAYLLYEGETHGRILQQSNLSLPGDILLVVGPEGGFSAREAKLLQDADFLTVSLGKSILRWETAAILTLGMAWWARQ